MARAATNLDDHRIDPVKFGQMIKKARIAASLEVSECARIAQMSVAQWHKIESGTGGVPRVSTHRKMRQAVGLEKEPGLEEDETLSDREVQEQLSRDLADLASEVRLLRLEMARQRERRR